MSDPLTDRLERFTPDGTGLDRDAILFAAGRASVRPERHWKTIAAVLALTQTLTLGLLLPWSDARSPVVAKESSAAPRLLESEEPTSSERVVPSLLGRRLPEEIPAGATLVGTDGYVPDAPPLSAGSVLQALPLN